MLTSEIIQRFSLPGELSEITEIRSGLINATYRVTRILEENASLDFIIQRINRTVFKNADAVMNNIAIVTQHLSNRTSGKQHLRLIPLCTGENYYESQNGDIWRCYSAIEDSLTYDVVSHPKQAYEAAKAFGQFIADLSDLDTNLLTETIPNFHNTPLRYATLREVVKKDPNDRVKHAQAELAFIEKRKHLLNTLESNTDMPKRIVHYDTKINNVMINPLTDMAVCVIDLDTVMPGYAVLDFGDLVRTAACSASEEETDLSKVYLNFDLYTAIYKGFLEGTEGLLTQPEIDALPSACRLITLELAIRFLTDYLLGDTYFKIERKAHNLHRSRNQIALVRSMEEQLNYLIN